MPIVLHTLQTNVQADGSSQNILRMYDGDAQEYLLTFVAPAGFNLQARVDSAIIERNEQLAESEFQTLLGL